MRVALLTRAAHPLHPPGGMERAVFHLATHLRAQGVTTVLLTRPATEPGEFPGEVLTVPYLTVPAGAHGRVVDRTFNYPRFAQRLGRAVAELVREARVDLVHAQGLTALGYARLRRRDRSLGAPLVMNPQGMEEHKTSGLKRLALTRVRALSREAARLSDRVIATDEATRDEVPRLLGVAASRVVVLPNGIDADEIVRATPAEPRTAAGRALPALGDASPVFLSVGRLEAYKGFSDALLAFSTLHARSALPGGWAWVIVGEGRYGTTLRQRLASLDGKGDVHRRIGAHVHLAGRVGEDVLHALYARADAFVHPTRYEGSSLVTLEAMAHSLPVVAARAGGIPDKVVPEETGLLVDPGDVDGLTAAIARLGSDDDLRKRMGSAGREHVLAHFAWPGIARRTIALYEELLAGRR